MAIDIEVLRRFLVGAPPELLREVLDTTETTDSLEQNVATLETEVDNITAQGGYSYPAVAASAANVTAEAGQNVRYDASSFTGTLFAPASPTAGQRFAYKEVGGDVTAVSIDGNGNNIEEPISGAFSASFTVGQAYIGVEYEFDGTQWIIP